MPNKTARSDTSGGKLLPFINIAFHCVMGPCTMMICALVLGKPAGWPSTTYSCHKLFPCLSSNSLKLMRLWNFILRARMHCIHENALGRETMSACENNPTSSIHHASLLSTSSIQSGPPCQVLLSKPDDECLSTVLPLKESSALISVKRMRTC